ncbi:unnamed protein product [Gulo gulo]|uniref:Phospholipase A2-like central domain-containing protein n=1 Tax=Gulo gulo TaxID=48420 RepID=A0A9X9LGQ4_GULGU|nr:unnamed protein product [Gulo gulo]
MTAAHRTSRLSSTAMASETTDSTPSPIVTVMPGSSNACRTSETPSRTSWAWPSSMCWRSPALCLRSRRRVWRGTGGEGMWLLPSISFPARGGARAPSPRREACLYVCPPANDASSSLCSPQKQHPQKRPPQRKGSKHSHKTNTTALWVPMASTKPDMSPTAWLEVTHPGLHRPQDGLKPRDARRACRSFHRLDQCEQQIGPQETKFQLLNGAHEPLFHCNCTRRLARFLRLHSPPEGTNVLWELLGMTCFELAPPLDCAEGKGCSGDPRAIKVSARHLRRLQKRRLQLWDVGTADPVPGAAGEHGFNAVPHHGLLGPHPLISHLQPH